MTPPVEDADAHERAWDVRYLDPALFADLVGRLEPGPVTTFLECRVALNEGRLDDVLTGCDRAEHALPEDSVWRARLLETRGNVLSSLGLSDEAQSVLAEAWRRYELVGDLVGRASIRQNTAILGFQPNETRAELLREALVLARQARRDDLVGLVLLNLANEISLRPSRTDADDAERRRLVAEAGDVLGRAWPLMALRVRGTLVELAVEDGDLDRAEELFSGLPGPFDVQDPTVRAHLADVAATLARARGVTADDANLLDGVLASGLLPEDVPILRNVQAQLYRALGRYEEAMDAYASAYDALSTVLDTERSTAGRALDVWHRTSQLRLEREAAASRADALESALAQLQAAKDRVQELSVLDTVTGLHNRQWLMDQAPEALQAATPRCAAQVALIDLDHFKQVNDTFGHATGDGVLRFFASALVDALPETDLVARYGGEEFVVIRPAGHGGDGGGGLSLADDLAGLRTLLAAGPWQGEDGEPLPPVTLSAGVVKATAEGLASALRDADALMYEAKADGRDRVRVDRRAVPRSGDRGAQPERSDVS